MLLNTKIFNQTVETAKLKSANNPAMLRTIDRAVKEINKSKYWAYDSQTNVLKLMSTTSSKLYVIDDNHTCEAQSKTCKHHIARRLMQRYTEALGVVATEGERAGMVCRRRANRARLASSRRRAHQCANAFALAVCAWRQVPRHRHLNQSGWRCAPRPALHQSRKETLRNETRYQTNLSSLLPRAARHPDTS
jgi:hypothetical protein